MKDENNKSKNITFIISSNGKNKEAWEILLNNIISNDSNINNDIISYIYQSLIEKTNIEINLDILDFIVQYGSLSIIEVFVNKNLSKQILELLKNNSKSSINVQKKIIFLIQKWARKYAEEKEQIYSAFINNYESLKKEGIMFPPDNFKMTTYNKYISDEEVQNIINKTKTENENSFENPFLSEMLETNKGDKKIFTNESCLKKNLDDDNEENPYNQDFKFNNNNLKNNNNIKQYNNIYPNNNNNSKNQFPNHNNNNNNKNNYMNSNYNKIKNNKDNINNYNRNNNYNNNNYNNNINNNNYKNRNNNNFNNNNVINYIRTNTNYNYNNNRIINNNNNFNYFSSQNNNKINGFISYKRTLGNRLLQLNSWIDEDKYSPNFCKLKEGIIEIINEIPKCENMMNNCTINNDKKGYETYRNMKMDMEQTCSRYEDLVNDRYIEPFRSSFFGNSRKYYFNKNQMFGNNKISVPNNFNDYYKNRNNNYGNSNQNSYGSSNNRINYDEREVSVEDKLVEYGGKVKDGLCYVGGKIKDVAFSGFNFVKNKIKEDDDLSDI